MVEDHDILENHLIVSLSILFPAISLLLLFLPVLEHGCQCIDMVKQARLGFIYG